MSSSSVAFDEVAGSICVVTGDVVFGMTLYSLDRLGNINLAV